MVYDLDYREPFLVIACDQCENSDLPEKKCRKLKSKNIRPVNYCLKLIAKKIANQNIESRITNLKTRMT